MSKYSVPDKQFQKAVEAADSMRELCILLDVRVSGRAYKVFRERIANLKLDNSHWGSKKQKKAASRAKLEDILVKDSDYIDSASLKKMLLREGKLEYRCYTCGIRDWQGKFISLHLDHINGERTDHRIQNLRFLCPNCHTQTPTYGSKNRRKKSASSIEKAIEKGKKKLRNKYKFCALCNKGINRTATHCKSCAAKLRDSPKYQSKIEWPDIDTLFKMVKEKGYSAVGRELGVSDNAVRKHILKNS